MLMHSSSANFAGREISQVNELPNNLRVLVVDDEDRRLGEPWSEFRLGGMVFRTEPRNAPHPVSSQRPFRVRPSLAKGRCNAKGLHAKGVHGAKAHRGGAGKEAGTGQRPRAALAPPNMSSPSTSAISTNSQTMPWFEATPRTAPLTTGPATPPTV